MEAVTYKRQKKNTFLDLASTMFKSAPTTINLTIIGTLRTLPNYVHFIRMQTHPWFVICSEE